MQDFSDEANNKPSGVSPTLVQFTTDELGNFHHIYPSPSQLKSASGLGTCQTIQKFADQAITVEELALVRKPASPPKNSWQLFSRSQNGNLKVVPFDLEKTSGSPLKQIKDHTLRNRCRSNTHVNIISDGPKQQSLIKCAVTKLTKSYRSTEKENVPVGPKKKLTPSPTVHNFKSKQSLLKPNVKIAPVFRTRVFETLKRVGVIKD